MSVAAVFALQVGDVSVGERDLPIAVSVVPELIGPDYLNGTIALLATGQPVAYIEDDLEFTVQQLLEAVPALASGESFAVGFSEAPGSVRFAPDGPKTTVTADYFRAFTADTAQLLPAVVDCCDRFVTFARSAFAHDPGVTERLEQLQPWLADARAALAHRTPD